MLVSNWPNSVAHVDADCFYASCERARNPKLRNTPVCVLSSHDACVVAKTYDAKAVGITTGMPVWEAKKLLPHAEYLSADFRYYGQMSDQMIAILRQYSPEIEVYSIDEAFIGMNGLRSLWRKSYRDIADTIRNDIRMQLGITVSIGISVTKTLAKIASDFNKPDGTTLVPGKQIEAFLAQVAVKDIPGIGRNRDELLAKFKIRSAPDFINTPQAMIRGLLGKPGVDLWYELRGTQIQKLELEPKLPKTIARTASMGDVSSDFNLLASHLTHHTTRLAMEMARKRYVTSQLAVFLTLKNFDSVGYEIRLQCPTANYFMLSGLVHKALNKLYQPEQLYRGCGVVASDIQTETGQTFDVFGVMRQDIRQAKLLETMNEINSRYGKDTVKMLATMTLRQQKRVGRFVYPVMEAS